MPGDKEITLNLQNSPLIVSLAALDSNSELLLDWPDRLEFAKLDLPKKIESEVSEKLSWIKRQYGALIKNPASRAYAPHVVPFVSLVHLKVSSHGHDFALSAVTRDDYLLDYTKNLAKALNDSLDLNMPFKSSKLAPTVDGVFTADRVRFRVLDYQPLNELEVGLQPFYRKSGLAYAAAVEAWLEQDYAVKLKFLESEVQTGSAKVNYQMEVVLEPQLLLGGLQSKFFILRSIQNPTPAHGYSLPKKLSDGGMIERCFDMSYELHSIMMKKNAEAAPLMCLWGHRQRALINIDLSGLRNMASAKKGRLKRLADALLNKVAEKHPIIVEEVRATDKKKK